MSHRLHIEGLTMIEFPEDSVHKIMRDTPIEEAIWDETEQKVMLTLCLASNQQRFSAHKKIVAVYPLWRQCNILRSGNTTDIQVSGKLY